MKRKPMKDCPLSNDDWDKLNKIVEDGVPLSSNPKRKEEAYAHLKECAARCNINENNPICLICGKPTSPRMKIGVCSVCRVSLVTRGKVRSQETLKKSHRNKELRYCEVCGGIRAFTGLCHSCYKMKKRLKIATNKELFDYRRGKNKKTLERYIPEATPIPIDNYIAPAAASLLVKKDT